MMNGKENKLIGDRQEDNLYVYQEDDATLLDPVEKDSEASDIDASDLDNSGPNYSQSHDSEINSGLDNGGSPRAPRQVFPLLLKVLLNPVEGWKTMRRKKITAEEAQTTCFYPLLGLFSIGKFADLYYDSKATVSDVLVSAISAFVSFFFGYFCILMLMKALLPKSSEKEINSEFSKVFVAVSLASLCMFFTVLEVLPMLWAILIFLPLWTLYIVCAGARFYRFPENRNGISIAILCVLILGVPCVFDWLLGLILPR